MYSENFRLSMSQVDSGGKMTVKAIMEKMQDVAIFEIESRPNYSKYFISRNCNMIMIYRQLDIIRYPTYGEELTAVAQIYNLQKLLGNQNIFIKDKNGNICAVAYTIGVYYDLTNRVMIKAPPEYYEGVQLHKQYEDMEYTSRRITIPQCGCQQLDEYKVSINDIDRFVHMNNVAYVNLVREYIPNNYIIKRVRTEYQIPLALGDIVIPYLYKPSDNTFIFVLKNKDNNINAVIEFVC